MTQTPSSLKRPHIYEIDLIRGITVLSVVTLHSLAATQFLLTSLNQSYFVNLLIHLLQYGREIFIFVTGLVLTYSYFGRPFSAKKFWLRRTLLIFLPYVFWSAVYVKINNPATDLTSYFSVLGIDILTGGASYQLYYILLALQLYLIFPLFMPLLKQIFHRPWTVLSGLFLLQIIMDYFNFSYLQNPSYHLNGFLWFINTFQNRIFLSYIFFFVLGAFAAIYMEQSIRILRKLGKFLPIVAIGALIYSIIYYYHVVFLTHNIYYATSVFQPVMVIYSIIIIIFFFWLSSIWARKLRMYQLVKIISDTSFGIYFVHVFILSAIVKYGLPILSGVVPAGIKIALTAMATVIMSILLCYVLLKTPGLRLTIGRVRKRREV